ncbi:chromate transporter [Rhodosalinus halophilus]|uniref:Chromate transporter n=1 Tax=Rhodosalinus halophilus TaxID=2259333 RepID=A0A365UA06_9RHOB|nr:chromate efflux transporter [Rhodosalinus halophilus]RBI85799.1 chromate transporter [Rhodosalinus halophilus]
MPDAALSEITRAFLRIGVLSFGGPAAQISLMHRELVEERGWLSEAEYLRALSFCMLLPGPEAMQLATYAGWRLRGVPGGLIAGGLFVAPGAVVIGGLAAGYIAFGEVPLVQAVFAGVQAAVVAIVLQALLRLGGKALRGPGDWTVAGLAFAAIFILGLPFPAILAAAALWGAWAARDEAAGPTPPPGARPRTLATVALWGALWAAPLVPLWLAGAGFLTDLALFFGWLALVTFGGAYAVLAYMTQAVVGEFGWLTTAQMIDTLGLAETTPGPLILVTQFVGHLAGHAQGGWALGLLAGLLVLWMTFVPCFLWIFAGAPYVEALASRPRLQGALSGITAAVVGVILNLALWFALHVLFGDMQAGPAWLAAPLPVWSSLDPVRFGLVLLALALIVWRGMGVAPAIAAMGAAGALAGQVAG